jgi:hypothetical protein
MNVSQIAGLVQGALSKGGGWSVEGDVSFTRTLTLGQILKARVLRHYEGGRYLTEINGQQKVVDSAIPLKVGEVVHGRVTALDDRVHLQRIAQDTLNGQQPSITRQAATSSTLAWVDQLLARYDVALTKTDRSELLRLIGRSQNPQLMALSGVIVNKLGLTLSSEFLQALYRVFNTKQIKEILQDLDSPYQLKSTTTSAPEESSATIQQLAGLIEESAQELLGRTNSSAVDDKANNLAQDQYSNSETREPLSDGNSGNDRKQNWDGPLKEWLLGQRLLNSQNEGSVNHRLTHLPLWFGNRLVEISIALFSQQQDTCVEDGTRHRRLVISLDTVNLGHLDITLNLADQHCRVCLTTEDEASTNLLASHFGELKGVIEDNDWILDEIKYATDTTGGDDAALRAVVEHQISQGSLSRLM